MTEILVVIFVETMVDNVHIGTIWLRSYKK